MPLSKPTTKPSGCFLAGLLRMGTSMPGWVPGTEQPPCLHSGVMSDHCHTGGLPPTQPSLPQPYTHTCPGWLVPLCPVLQQTGGGVQLLFQGVPDPPHHPSAYPALAQHCGHGSSFPHTHPKVGAGAGTACMSDFHPNSDRAMAMPPTCTSASLQVAAPQPCLCSCGAAVESGRIWDLHSPTMPPASHQYSPGWPVPLAAGMGGTAWPWVGWQ